MKTNHFLAALLTVIAPLLYAEEIPKGLAKSDWASIREAYEAGRHAFQPVEGGWQARNPGQQWMTKFDGRGFVAEPTDGGWRWGLELKSYGFAGKEQAIGGEPAVKADGQRLTYQWDSTVQEWFVNDQRGLEHGYTVNARPAGTGEWLGFTIGIRGDLRPAISADTLAVSFQNESGATVLTYAGLKVWDADGKTLPSHFAPAESGVRLLVDERGARYPITVDPIAQQAYVKASNSGDGDQFGYSVAISGNTVVIGAPSEDGSGTGVNPTSNNSATDAGAAYVFVRSGAIWSQQAYLKASNTGAADRFGWSVSVSGDTVLIGAPFEDGSGNQVNPPSNELESDAGAAYVFVRSGVTWSQQAYLKGSASGSGDLFGISVAVSGDTVVVGASGEGGSGMGINPAINNFATEAGAAYVFVRSGVTWSNQANLKASNTDAGDLFGNSVAVSGDTVIIGARLEDGSGTGVNPVSDNLAINAGAAYVFVRSGVTWSQQAYLKASNTELFDEFGGSVAVSGDKVIVGATHEDGGGTGVNPPSDEAKGQSGAAYVFVRSGVTWSQQAYLKASNSESVDQFGYSVAASNDTVVVGAYWEAGSGTGANPASDELALKAGAAYVFVRNGGTWSQQAYLKASNTDSFDEFGYSVAVSAGTVIVGAIGESGSNNGVNPASNNAAPDAGAAYIFTGLGTPEIAVELDPPIGVSLDIPNHGTINFDAANVNGVSDLFVYIYSLGEIPLELTGTPTMEISGPDAAMFSIDNQPSAGPVNSSVMFIVGFNPTTVGPKSAVLTIHNTDGDEGDFIINLIGTGPPPEIAVEQAGSDIVNGGSKSFGTTPFGTLVFTIKNTGETLLFLSGNPLVAVSGPDAANFTITAQPASSVSGPSGSTTFTVQFAPLTEGPKSAVLTIPNSDTSEPSFTINLTGTAPPPEIAVEQAAVNINDGTSKNLGGAIVGTTMDVVFTIKNTGGSNLTLNGNPKVSVGGPQAAMFTVTAQPTSPVGFGAETTFTVRFAPTSAGGQTAALTIPNNDANEGPFNITIMGTGLTFTTDTDGDGLNDASELQMAALGFDWNNRQDALVSTLISNANGAGLYTQSQYNANYNAGRTAVVGDPHTYGLFTLAERDANRVAGRADVTVDPNAYGLYTLNQIQTLNVGTPLLQNNPTTGVFTLTIGVSKSTDLINFTGFPMTLPQTTINGQGKLEFQFTTPGNAAFFRVLAQ